MVMLISKGSEKDLEKYHLKWIAQRKYDGVLAIAKVLNSDVILKGRNGTDLTKRFPKIVDELKYLINGVYVGEIVCDTFKHTCMRAKTENKLKSKLLCESYPAKMMLFDKVCEGEYKYRFGDIQLDKHDRFNHLEVVDWTYDLIGLWEKAKKENWEGIIIKNPMGKYENKRTKSQLKIKYVKSKDIVFDRYEINPAGLKLFSKDREFDVKVQCSGSQSLDVRKEIEETGSCICEVEYLNETESGKLRMPVFKEKKDVSKSNI